MKRRGQCARVSIPPVHRADTRRLSHVAWMGIVACLVELSVFSLQDGVEDAVRAVHED